MTIEQRKEIQFSLSYDKKIELVTGTGVFTPNATTDLLIHGVKELVTEPSTLLDLGCGTGVVGLALHYAGLVKEPLQASDLSSSAVECSRENFERYGCPAVVREGSLFEPWHNKKFDIIVDDISGIAQDVADISPWFQGVPCDTGKDGIDLVVEILRSAPEYLNSEGRIFFPVLSLSNVDMILKEAKDTFTSVVLVGRKDWPLPKDLYIHLPLLRKLNAEGAIKLEERFGMVLCYTEVYCARNI